MRVQSTHVRDPIFRIRVLHQNRASKRMSSCSTAPCPKNLKIFRHALMGNSIPSTDLQLNSLLFVLTTVQRLYFFRIRVSTLYVFRVLLIESALPPSRTHPFKDRQDREKGRLATRTSSPLHTNIATRSAALRPARCWSDLCDFCSDLQCEELAIIAHRLQFTSMNPNVVVSGWPPAPTHLAFSV